MLKISSLKVSSLSNKIVQSEIRNMSIECDKLNGINLSQGICDLPVPEIVMRGADAAVRSGLNQYTRYDGIPELRKAISKKLKDYNHIDSDPEKNIIVSSGATGALYCACIALLNPGDEVIVFEPFYGYHINTLLAVSAIPKYVTLNPPQWTFNIKDVEKCITNRTKAILINTPGNPTGKVFTRAELEAIADLSIQHDLFVFTDEIYEYFTFGSIQHISPGSIDRIRDRTITISGYSKVFSITGWRIGYCCAHEKWAKMIGYVNDLIYVCAPAPLQKGVADGIENLDKQFYEDIREGYKIKRDILCDCLTKIGMTPYIPDGAYYVLADGSKLPGKDSKERAMYLLQKTKVASVPGEAFVTSDTQSNLLRFCFGKKEEELKKACKQLLQLKVI